MMRRESFGSSTFTRRGSSTTNPKVIVPRKRIIVSRTMSDGSTYSRSISDPKARSNSQTSPLQLVLENTVYGKPHLYSLPTAPPCYGNDNVYFPPDFYAIQKKGFS